jgi:hypothetical protein
VKPEDEGADDQAEGETIEQPVEVEPSEQPEEPAGNVTEDQPEETKDDEEMSKSPVPQVCTFSMISL